MRERKKETERERERDKEREREKDKDREREREEREKDVSFRDLLSSSVSRVLNVQYHPIQHKVDSTREKLLLSFYNLQLFSGLQT